jgi:hypothetical protein
MSNISNPVLVAEPVEVEHGEKMYENKDFGGKIVAKQNFFYAKINVSAKKRIVI